MAHPFNVLSMIQAAVVSSSPSMACWVTFHIYYHLLCLFNVSIIKYLARHHNAHDLHVDCKLLIGDVEEDVFAVLVVRHGPVEGATSKVADEDHDP